jgi:hypothetical protein
MKVYTGDLQFHFLDDCLLVQFNLLWPLTAIIFSKAAHNEPWLSGGLYEQTIFMVTYFQFLPYISLDEIQCSSSGNQSDHSLLACDATQLLYRYQHFRGICYLHLCNEDKESFRMLVPASKSFGVLIFRTFHEANHKSLISFMNTTVNLVALSTLYLVDCRLK